MHSVIDLAKDDDLVVGRHRDVGGQELIAEVVVAQLAPHADEFPVGREHLDSMVPEIGDVDLASRIERNAPRMLKLTRLPPEPSPRQEKLAARRELYDPVVTRVGDVDLPRR